ncbi:MAG: class I SAM-dependent methyltransferase [Lentisphaeraceae bacterium]|nr:class I SAM-dependent methyltransferase [Lentisphaeraceae bacterium]
MCPLCRSDKYIFYCEDKFRTYQQCTHCFLVFVEDTFLLSKEEEKAVYDLHENDVDDPGYRKFLSRLADPLCKKLAPKSSGLEFGCGPGPALAKMLEEKGFNIKLYDLYYFPDRSVLDQTYDFISATEVVEHVKDSASLFETFSNCLNENGKLGIMTKLVIDQKAFSTWHYKNDQTHIRFFSKETFLWIADKWNFSVSFYGKDVIIIEKK